MSIDSADTFDAPAALFPARAGKKESSVSRPSRSLLRQAVIDTSSSRLAQAGMLWLGFLGFLAVFAPFIASSHPIVMKTDGQWSSPLLKHLTPADVMLLITTFTTIVLAIGRWLSFWRSVAALLVVLAVAVVPCYWCVRAPENVDYTRYRVWAAEGKIESAIYTLIPYSPRDRLRDRIDARLLPPGPGNHWCGTDTNGADLASNLIHASRIALAIGFLATGISVGAGVIIGGFMGYYVGLFDLLGMRFIEIIESIPRLFLLITVTAFLHNRNIYVMMAVIGCTGWTGYARYLRAQFLTLRKQDFVQAAIAAGLPEWSVVFRHMLPNGLTPILVNTTFSVASAILYESTLSFLGLGLVDEPSWGALLNQARAGGAGFIWWIALFPGAAIFLTMFSYNLVGEAARDALDPKLRKRD